MSAKKSWDRRTKRAPEAPVREARGRSALKERRRKARTIFSTLLVVIAVITVLGAIYVVWQSPVRIHTVTVEGTNADHIRALTEAQLQGTYAFVVPRNSIFFYPEQDIRESVLREHPEVAAVAVSRQAFDTIVVRAIERMPAFMWCGPTVDVPSPDGTCFSVDAEGMVFAPVLPEVAASSTALRIYAPLDSEDDTTLRSHVLGSHAIPGALRFVKAIRAMGIPISSLVLRGDEADLWVNSSTRITYVLGREEEAAQLADAAFPTLNLRDGSIAYVDLRFNKKVYIKRYGE
jgi:hypothetical protein